MSVVLAAGAAAIVPTRQADAATVHCGSPMHVGQGTTVSYANYIDLYADPACSGNRYVAYDFYGTTNIQMDYIYVDFARAWLCGSLYINVENKYAFNSDWTNIWTSWFPPNSCGFQAHQVIRFFKSGVIDQWTWAFIN